MSKKDRKNSKVPPVIKASFGKKYVLKLFVTGNLPNSSRAIINIKAICRKHLRGRYDLEIIDIYQQPAQAIKEDIIAAPLLIKKFPLPEERLVGDLSDNENVLKGLRLA
ncbi:MAG TPA: circadian clock KaiB family protein [Puia sp.]|nr:circadian clock KaiB family protein [Puia sp.]